METNTNAHSIRFLIPTSVRNTSASVRIRGSIKIELVSASFRKYFNDYETIAIKYCVIAQTSHKNGDGWCEICDFGCMISISLDELYCVLDSIAYFIQSTQCHQLEIKYI